MEKIFQGVHRFRTHVFPGQRALFEALESAQRPEVLFITCSDSRIDPALITQMQPGELFVLRNAGNIVPPYGQGSGAEAATIEFAVRQVRVRHIIVCGHSQCAAMQRAVESPESDDFPALRAWLVHAQATRQIVQSKYSALDPGPRLNAAIQINVLVQLDHLHTHPAVAEALAEGRLQLHGWVYRIGSGQIFQYNAANARFEEITDTSRPMPVSRLLLPEEFV